MEKTISHVVEKEYKTFSKYVCYNRAIPHIIDGFKPSQRKAFFCLKSKTKFEKVLSVSGRMISEANYHHGDTSASDMICKMAQDFTGANNITPFIGDGEFGNKFIQSAGAPRYIFVKPNPFYYSLFKDEILTHRSEDLEDPEPKYYLPIIPTILLNGIKGIAVGFATEIQPYYIKDIIKLTRKFLNNTFDYDFIRPYYKGYNGEILYNDEIHKFEMYGIYETINTTTLRITEIPVNFDREKYIKFLDKLIGKELIYSYEENNNDEDQWDILLRLPRKSQIWEDPVKHLKLCFVLNENITVLDEDNKLRIFDCIENIIRYFVDFRYNVYKQRRQYMIDKLTEDILYSKSKIKFIIMMCSIDFKNMTKNQIRKFALSKGCKKHHLEKHLEIRAHNLNKSYLIEIKKKIKELEKELKWYEKITAKKLYEIDLNELEKNLKKENV